MPMWRCPHCATPQPEASRCWVCRRSSTCCATCRHFRRSIAAKLGYCGLDRGRRPLGGDEIRPCWETTAAFHETVAGDPATTPRPPKVRTPVRVGRDFVPLDGATDSRPPATGGRLVTAVVSSDGGSAGIAAQLGDEAATGGDGPRWTLFPDLEG